VSATLVIEASRGWSPLRLKELWAYRELIYFLAWRDVKVRYKQTALGILWAVFQPFMTMVVFRVFFGALAGIPSDGLPYPLFALAALVPWMFFSNAVGTAAGSLLGNATLLTRVYFPRLAIPIAGIAAAAVDLVCTLGVFALVAGYFRHAPGASLFLLPCVVVVAAVVALGVGIWLAALTARFRDVRYLIPFFLQLWLFATPVAYPSSLVPARWQTLYALNPMVGVIDGFRSVLLGQPDMSFARLAWAAAVGMVVLVTGALVFRRIERTLADSV
jgi:lipopolysaccharide transport system permease protein